jgi:hypothetical protein
MSWKRAGVENRVAGGLVGVVALAGCAHNPLADPPPRELKYEQAIDCAGLLSALHRLGEPEGWTYDQRADMFVYWAEDLAPGGMVDGVTAAVRASTARYLSRFPDLKLMEDAAVLEPLQEQLRQANAERVYQCERLSPAFDIVIVASGGG